MTKLIVIVGITGQKGGSVARFFSSLSDWKIRGLTRNPSSPSSLHWTSLGVEIIAADLSCPSTLASAFSGATAIFSTTDFWGPFYDPSTPALLKDGENLAQFYKEAEKMQGVNVADAASKIVGLERLVVSALCHAEEGSVGIYRNVAHWDGKAEAVKYLKETYPGLAEKTTVVVVGNYMENWMMDIKLRKQTDGSFRLALVGSGKTPQPHISIADDLGSVVHAALLTPPGKIILAARSMLSYTLQLQIWCEANQVLFGSFDELSVDMFEKFFSSSRTRKEFGEMMAFIDEFGYAGIGRSCCLSSFEEFVKKQDWSKQLNA
ncbi:putative NAD dependent epimerase/dehydratase [Rhexocercosporidium sp. MPI-PUGE-AT-0058]|nr:putative NAD dependent epimerase/dehydratase [Rhexocercosporidium sp. MPI-PUGE-AT-0058]